MGMYIALGWRCQVGISPRTPEKGIRQIALQAMRETKHYEELWYLRWRLKIVEGMPKKSVSGVPAKDG